MTDDIRASLGDATPPDSLSAPLKALWWLEKGDLRMGDEWRKAHEICQSQEGDKAHDWVHGLVHWIEGDAGNTAYWYRRVGEKQVGPDVAAEWDRLVTALGG